MLKGLFKSAWKSNSVEKRLSFITDIDVSSASNQTILEKLANNDVEASVRSAAMAKISNPQVLYDLSQSDDGVADNSNAKLADVAFRNLLQSGGLTEGDFKSFLSKNPKSDVVLAKYCPLVDVRNELLLSLNEIEQADIISDVAYSNTRILLAEKIQGIEALEVARKNLKGKDKNAEKIIKAKIDAIHATQKLELENTALVKSIREKMEALARYVQWSDEIKVKFFSLEKQWNTLDFEASTDEKLLYQQAFTKVSADVKHHVAITSSQQNQEKIISTLESKCSAMAAYSLDKLLSDSSIIENNLKDLSEQLGKESETIPYSSNISERFIEASKAIKSALRISHAVSDLRGNDSEKELKESNTDSLDEASKKSQDIEPESISLNLNQRAKAVVSATSYASKQAGWSSKFPALESANEAISEANEVLNASKDARKQAKDTLDNLHKRINRLFGAAQRGDIGRAQRELAAAIKATKHYEGSERKKLDERIEEVSADLTKMGDWKDFAIEPKLLELCEQMEALPELERTSKNPSADKLAAKIKKLQQSWKALGSSDISDAYWERFKEAGDKAYEPCAVFFKQKREIQKANLKKREPLVEKMKDLFESTDWDAKPDYKSIEDSISQIMQSWKKIKDVDHGPGQKQWERLAKCKDQINKKLDVEYEKNISAKHSLIKQLDGMLEQDDTENNINEQTLEKLQFIQGKWKQIGLTRRSQDQAAWVKFKFSSDAVFERIQKLRQAKRSVEDEKMGAYKQIHTQIHSLAKSTQDLSQSDKEFAVLEEQYKALPALPTELPEKLIERLDKDYARACDAYAGAKDRLNQAKLDNELDTLAAKAKLCSTLEKLSDPADQATIDDLEDKINKLEINNKDYLKRFSNRLEKARETDREAFANARRLLLIECEILLDIESPKEDKDLRLKIQLDRMKEQGFGNVPINAAAKMDDLKLEWLCMPGAEATLQKKFDARFKKLLK